MNTDKLINAILVDDDFIHYVLNPTEQLKQKWNNYFENHPDQLPIANEAKKILTGEAPNHQLSTLEIKEMEMEIFAKCGLMNCN